MLDFLINIKLCSNSVVRILDYAGGSVVLVVGVHSVVVVVGVVHSVVAGVSFVAVVRSDLEPGPDLVVVVDFGSTAAGELAPGSD